MVYFEIKDHFIWRPQEGKATDKIRSKLKQKPDMKGILNYTTKTKKLEDVSLDFFKKGYY